MSLCNEPETFENTTSPSHNIRQVAASFYARIKNAVKTRRFYAKRRDAFKTLLQLDAATLNDIGLEREAVLWASKLPLDVNASEELEKIRQRRASNTMTSGLR